MLQGLLLIGCGVAVVAVTSCGQNAPGSLTGDGGISGGGGTDAASGDTGSDASGSGSSGGSSSSDSGGASADGSSGGGPPTDGGAKQDGAGALPWLRVQGNLVQDSNGNTVILRGVAIRDIGALDSASGGNTGLSNRIDEILSTSNPSLDTHVVRLPVYPETCFNGGYPYYSPEPYPVGTPAPTGTMVTLLGATDYINNVLKPAVDYATSKSLYVIIDFHQIDDVTTGTNNSSAAAVTFWTTVAPDFA